MQTANRSAGLGFFLLLMVLLGACNLPTTGPVTNKPAEPPATNKPQSTSQVARADTAVPAAIDTRLANFTGPKAGAPMAWFDGSVLIFIPDAQGTDNVGQKGYWVTLDPITNYQYSLCVQTGACQAPGDQQSASDYFNPLKENLMVTGIGTDLASNYCSWIDGRSPTAAELTNLGQISNPFFAGGLPAADFFALGFHCILDKPAPRPVFAHSSAYYDPDKPVETMMATVANSNTYCQNEVPYQSLDLTIIDPDNNATLHSVIGSVGTTCQQVPGSNRVVCFGGSGPNSQAIVGLLCDGFSALKCQAGFEMNGSGCSSHLSTGQIAGMDDWEFGKLNSLRTGTVAIGDDWEFGILSPLNPIQLPGGALAGPALRKHVVINGVMVAQQLQSRPGPCYADATSTPGGQDLAPDQTPGPGDFGYFPIDYYECIHHLGPWAHSANNPNEAAQSWHPIPVPCPVGYYFDAQAQACIGLMHPVNGCPTGYSWNADIQGCEAAQPAKNYPGCPPGQVLDPASGTCDSFSQVLSPTKLLQTTLIQLSLPACAVPTKEKKKNENPGTGATCPAGQSWVCSGITHITCACK